MLQIYKLSLKSEACSDIHRLLAIECICAFIPGEEGDKLRYVSIMMILDAEVSLMDREVSMLHYLFSGFSKFYTPTPL